MILACSRRSDSGERSENKGKMYRTIHMKATEQYFPVVLFIILPNVVLTFFESVNEILKCDHSNESY